MELLSGPDLQELPSFTSGSGWKCQEVAAGAVAVAGRGRNWQEVAGSGSSGRNEDEHTGRNEDKAQIKLVWFYLSMFFYKN